MSTFFPRRNFLCANLPSNFLVEVKSNHNQVSLRTWLLSDKESISNVMSLEDAKLMYGEYAKPFELNSDLESSRKIKQNNWVPLAALGGNFVSDKREENLFLKPISQVGFIVDKSIIGSSAWSDYSVWVFNAKRDGTLSIPFNRYLFTKESKQHRNVLLVSRTEINLLTIIVPFATGNLDGCAFTLRYNQTIGCIHHFGEYRQMPSGNIGFDPFNLEEMYGVKALMPSLRLGGPDRIASRCTARTPTAWSTM
jgi:hypothetical protein